MEIPQSVTNKAMTSPITIFLVIFLTIGVRR